MKLSSWRYAAIAAVGVFALQSVAGASVAVMGGSLYAFAGSNSTYTPLFTNPYNQTSTLNGTGSNQGNNTYVDYSITSSGFLLNDFTLSRTNDHGASLAGSVTFGINAATNYNMSGLLKFAENDIPGMAGISVSLTQIDGYSNETTLAAFYNYNTSSDLGKLTLGTSEGDYSQWIGSLSGVLQTGYIYKWSYNIQLIDANYVTGGDVSNAPAVATGDLGIVFTDGTGNPPAPEPATVGILGLTGLALVLRRRK